MTFQDFARSIENGNTNGMITSTTKGKTRNSYSLWQYKVDGYRIYYKFVKMISLALLESEYAELCHVNGLTSDWHTQASVTYQINDLRAEMRLQAQEESGAMPFGKYKGMTFDQISDLSYLCWLGNQSTKDEVGYGGVDTWIKKAATTRANQLGAALIGGQLIDLNDVKNRFNANTSLIHKAVESHSEICYTAEQNDGRLWSAYNIDLPTITVGHSYYGTCNCLNIDGKARRAKGMQICIYDYTVDGNIIRVNGFYASK